MDIVALPKSSIKIKGRQAMIVVNPAGSSDANAAIVTNGLTESKYSPKEGVVIASPGEYEVAGVKIRGLQTDGILTFSLSVDLVDVLLGKLSSFERAHSKLQEHDVVVVDVDTVVDPSFVSSLSGHVILLTGAKSQEVVDTFIKDSVTKVPKFSSTKEKLPQEVETMLLSV